MWSEGTELVKIINLCDINKCTCGSRVMIMAATCSEDSTTVLCSNFNRSLKEAADYSDASFTVMKGIYEGIMYYSWVQVCHECWNCVLQDQEYGVK